MTEFDCWVDAEAKEIFLAPHFSTKGYKPNKWYSPEEAGIWLKCRAKKLRLGNYDKENARMNKQITPIIINGKNVYD